MSIIGLHLKGIVAAVAFIVTFSVPLLAQTTDLPPAEDAAPTADLTDESELLKRLAAAETEAEATRLDRQLQSLWSKSGSASMDLLLKRGREALEVEDTATAIEHLTALTDHAPDFAEGFHARASAYFNAELYGPALADLERALTLNPNNYNAIYGLGAILETFGDEKRAFQAYSRAHELHPLHEDVTKAVERLRLKVEGTSL